MNVQEIMVELEKYGNESTKRVLMNHGAKEPFFGVKVADLKKIVKKVKTNHDLAMALYKTGNSDAMYLAGLIADESRMSKEDIQEWVEEAYWYMLSEYTVPWVASESLYGEELADEWIQSENERVASAGWATWSNLVLIRKDEDLEIKKLRQLMKKAESGIHIGQNRINYTKNGFILAAGAAVKELTNEAILAGQRIGIVKVNMGQTACKVPYIPDYLHKMINMNKIGNKKKSAKC